MLNFMVFTERTCYLSSLCVQYVHIKFVGNYFKFCVVDVFEVVGFQRSYYVHVVTVYAKFHTSGSEFDKIES